MNSKRILSTAVLFVLAMVSVSSASQPATAQDRTGSQVVATTSNTVATVVVLTDEEAKQVVGGDECNGLWCGLIVGADVFDYNCYLDSPPPAGCVGYLFVSYEHRKCTDIGGLPTDDCHDDIYDVDWASCGCKWYEEYQSCSPDNSTWDIHHDNFCQ